MFRPARRTRFPVHVQTGGAQAVEDDDEGLDSLYRLMPIPRSVQPRVGITS
ncbi:hypothetical protein [Catenulispora acidiphila]|nr:hypothetical protein [Catenulispora acidiphila]